MPNNQARPNHRTRQIKAGQQSLVQLQNSFWYRLFSFGHWLAWFNRYGPKTALLVLVCSTYYFSYNSFIASVQFSSTGLEGFQSRHNLSKISNQIETQSLKLGGFETKVDEVASTMVLKEDFFRPKPRFINWFSLDLGARAVEHLCSPPAAVSYPTLQSLWMPSKNTPDVRGVVDSATTALLPVQGGRSYCGPDRRGKLQLVVHIARQITPVELSIEHFRKGEVPKSGMAPKEVELWVQVMDDAIRDAIRVEMDRLYPAILRANHSQPDRFLAKEQALDSTWVPIGQWTYNIWDRNNVQGFWPPLDLSAFGVTSHLFAVRVNSNWGDVDSTCLARVYMKGIDRSGRDEFLERPDKVPEKEARLVKYM